MLTWLWQEWLVFLSRRPNIFSNTFQRTKLFFFFKPNRMLFFEENVFICHILVQRIPLTFTSVTYITVLGTNLVIFFFKFRMSNFGLEPQTSDYRKNTSSLPGLQSGTVSVWLIRDDFCGLHACNMRTPLTRRLSLHK